MPFNLLQFLIPLFLAGVQYVRQEQARREIDQAEAAHIPGESSQISETLMQRGLGGSTYYGPAVAEPARMFEVARRVRRAQELLAQPTANPLATGMEAIMNYINRQQGGAPHGMPSPYATWPYQP